MTILYHSNYLLAIIKIQYLYKYYNAIIILFFCLLSTIEYRQSIIDLKAYYGVGYIKKEQFEWVHIGFKVKFNVLH